ncbi:MAG: DUF6067 family protein [Candidatus Omnitrophica bacterium]|nr:DUF6067 family protein [Candidatus Omnitrophota bacterium]
MHKEEAKRFFFGLFFFLVFTMASHSWSDPRLTITRLPMAPLIDGRVDEKEWQYASAVTGLMAYEAGALRTEQTVFYVGWYHKHIYIAMKAAGSTYDRIVARSLIRDDRFVCGDDAVELMIAPGSGKELEEVYFPTYYLIINSLGTVFDMKLRENVNEEYIAWNVPLVAAVSTKGNNWECEIKIPVRELTVQGITDGTKWRMNLTRAHAGYFWSCWVPGALNTYKTGGEITFDARVPAVRLLSVQPFLEGRTGAVLEVANFTRTSQTVSLSLLTRAVDEKAKTETEIETVTETITVKAREVKRLALGKGKQLAVRNRVVIEARKASGEGLLSMERMVNTPSPKFVTKQAPPLKLVSINCRYLPSLEVLSVYMNCAAKAQETRTARPALAEIEILKKGSVPEEPVLKSTFSSFVNNEGTVRISTEKIPEGEYEVLVIVKDSSGETIYSEKDWFVKKKIPHLTTDRRGLGEEVPAPFTTLEVAGNEIKPWGRTYRFGANGLPEQFVSQDRDILASPSRLILRQAGKTIPLQVTKPFTITKKTPGRVETETRLKAGNIVLTISSSTEYDGLTKFRIAYGPLAKSAQIDKMVLELPIRKELAKFYSAASDFLGDSILAGVLPEQAGIIYDSLNNTRSVVASPPFAALCWLGDYDISFCYCADTDEGWVVDDERAEVEVERKGEEVILRLNLVSIPYVLTQPRTLEFGLQAGPVKPLPVDWRSWQYGGVDGQSFTGNTEKVPNIWGFITGVGSWGLGGGSHLIHPGDTPEIRSRARAVVEKAFGGDRKVRRIGYCWWPNPPKGRPETRVYRSEWGITRDDWETANTSYYLSHYKDSWQKKVFGDDENMYTPIRAKVVPSLVDFYVYCWDETVKEAGQSGLWGFYFDQGYPNPVFDPELGLGYIREDGRKCYSSGLWLYRELLKRLAYVNFQHKIPNFLVDAQHHSHLMPAYGFLGIYAPCENAFYGGVLDYYKTIENYAAHTPAKQMGMIPQIGLTPQRGKDSVGFTWETRELMMMAMLHDQDLGSFGQRDDGVIDKLRACRNKLVPWKPEVKFSGYWENKETISTSAEKLLGSFYTCPRGALLVFGNVSKDNIEATIEVNWRKLGFNFKAIMLTDAENPDNRLVVSPDGKLTLFVPARGLRLISVTPIVSSRFSEQERR